MLTRQNVIEMFSTFAQLEEDKFSRWLTDTRLRKSIQTCLNESPEVANLDHFWALYWHKRWQTSLNNVAKMHLLAYLQEPFYLASKITVVKYKNTQYKVADYFQIANSEVEIIIKDFNAEKSSSLKKYAVMVTSSRLRDFLRQRKEADTCTNWALLRKVSTKTLFEALNQVGILENVIAQYRLAWICFKELYVYQSSGTKKQLPEPNRQLWSEIAELYNRERKNQINFYTEECTSEKIERWLTQTANCIRMYLFPPVKSLNALKTHSENNNTFDLPDPSSDSLLADMIAQEDIQNRKEQSIQMSTIVSNALQVLDVQSQEALRLYYQEGMTQQQIMQQLNISQSTVSRRLVKGRESLLAALIKWHQELNVNNSLNSSQIKDTSIALEEYLRNDYGQFKIN